MGKKWNTYKCKNLTDYLYAIFEHIHRPENNIVLHRRT